MTRLSPEMRDQGRAVAGRWELFSHSADVGVRGIGPTKARAFEMAAMALTAAICDPDSITPTRPVDIACEAPDIELLLVAWLNAVIYEMATRRMVFGRYDVDIAGLQLQGHAWGEAVDVERHNPGVEAKGATFTELRVAPHPDGGWVAQCVVDV